MSKPRKTRKQKSKEPKTLNLNKSPDEDDGTAMARMVIRPSVQGAATLREYQKAFGDMEIPDLVEALAGQIKNAQNNDSSRSEAMLITQAHTLDAIFNSLARRAINAEYKDFFESYLKLALKAQSQCRTTLEALSSIKNPPIMGYVRQANIAQGHQQVNNGTNPSAGENKNPQTQLLEANHGERLDTGTQGEAGSTDKEMATVGEINGAKNKRG